MLQNQTRGLEGFIYKPGIGIKSQHIYCRFDNENWGQSGDWWKSIEEDHKSEIHLILTGSLVEKEHDVGKLVTSLWFTFFAVHPDKKETFKFVAENKYQESRHVKPEHDYDWKDRMCLREEENFNINGTKLAYRDSKEIEISCEQDSEIEENYTEQTSKFKIYDRSFKIERHC